MSSRSWRAVEEIFQEALRRDPAQRDLYVRDACCGDAELQREVSSLLSHHDERSSAQSWAARAAAQLIDAPALEPGQMLGPYRIDSFLAAGGMGEVYRATDARLHREVAVKVCSGRFSDRFEQESRVIASLNHPHICQIYDVGPNYLVMEMVEGPTLADRILQGPIPLEEALAIARQIADALEAAHEKGRVHRDLKPANVKITPEGVVKVLDFGLAKALDTDPVKGDTANSPTLTLSATRLGMVMGTAAYMSPEQARGAAVDKRADIWAFGCVVYEMLSGKAAFQGETTSDILAAVLRSEPDWNALPAKTQPRIRKLLRRCLERDRNQRLRDIGEARIAIDANKIDAPEEGTALQPALRPIWPWAGAVAIAVLIAGWGWWRATRSAPTHPPLWLSVQPSPEAVIERIGSFPALSPDGTRLAFLVSGGDGVRRVATRRLDQNEVVTLAGTEGAVRPTFSPDGEWIAFNSNLKLRKISVHGGLPQALCDMSTAGFGGSWAEEDNIIAPLGVATGLSRIPAAGGAPTPVTTLKREQNELAHRWPQVLPAQQAILFSVYYTDRNYDDSDIEVLWLKTGQRKRIYRGGFFGRYLPSGHLVFIHQNTLFAARFDAGRMSLESTPQPAIESIANSYDGGGSFAFSRDGTAIYLSGSEQTARSIFWLDKSDKLQPLHTEPGIYGFPRLSPDGTRLAFSMENTQGGLDIWVKDLGRATTSRLTFLPGRNNAGAWSPDGKDIVFISAGAESRGVYAIRADGTGEPQRMIGGGKRTVSTFSPDGRRLAGFEPNDGGGVDIWTAPVERERDHLRLGQPETFVPSAGAIKLTPKFSPDGHWLAYQSNESGRNEIYVRPFPGPAGIRQISSGGGIHPMWSNDGRELFFVALDNRIMVVDYSTNTGAFVFDQPRVWAETRMLNLGSPPVSVIDLAPGGKRFAVILYADGSAEPKRITHLTFLLNFFDEVKQRVR
jgi:serine/threonine-protein kinase